jgi:zinc protease
MAKAKLDATRSRIGNGFAMAMNSNDRNAGALAPSIALESTPETLNRLFDTYQTVTPADIRDVVKKYFRAEGRTVVTLATKGQNIAALGRRGEEGQD